MSRYGRYSFHLFFTAAVVVAVSLCLPETAGARFLTDDTAAPQQPAKSDAAAAPAEAEVQNITAVLISGEKNSVEITWDSPSAAKESYIVLRSGYAMNTPEQVTNAIPIKTVPGDKLRMVVDRNLLPGRYFYAVFPKSKYDQRTYKLTAGENYTTNPVIVEVDRALSDSRVVAMLRAVTIEDRTVLLSWEPIGNFSGEYVIFRSNVPIDTQDRLSLAEPIARVMAAKSRYLDSDAGPGRHYYAIACKTVDGVLYSDLKKDMNFTADPVFVGGVIGVKMLRAQSEGSTVTVTWKSAANTLNREYYLIRSEVQPKGKDSISGAYIVASVQSAAEKHIDRNVPAGRHFYVLAPANYKDDEDFTLTRGVNVTEQAVVVEETKKKNEEKTDGRSSSLPAGPVAPVTPIVVPQPPSAAGTEDSIIANLVEIPLPEEGRTAMTDKPSEPLPADSIPEKSIPEVTPPADIAEQDQTAPVTPQPHREIEPSQKHSSAIKEPERELPKRETAKGEIRKAEPYRAPQPSRGVNEIIARQFDNGNYKQAIRELSQILPSLQGKSFAKALYHIGRSYVELRRFRDAVSCFSDDLVRRYYPKESEFWRDFSLERMK